jgi:hypothetical protein
MAPVLAKHKLTLTGSVDGGGKTYYFLARPGTYASIGSTVGITLVTEQSEMNNPNTSVAELLGSGLAFRILCHGKSGGAMKYFNVLCSRDKIGTALDGVINKTINGVTLLAAKGKRRASFF